MTPRDDMTVRIAAPFSQLSVEQLRIILQNLVLAVQNTYPDPITEELREALASAKVALAKGVQ